MSPSSLAKGAVAAAEAQQLEITACGHAKANKIQAEGAATAELIRAEADGKAEVVRAEGARTAAAVLQESEVAVHLAHIAKTGEALKGAGSSMFFGADPTALQGLLANPGVFEKRAQPVPV